jgi:hypothetical protein
VTGTTCLRTLFHRADCVMAAELPQPALPERDLARRASGRACRLLRIVSESFRAVDGRGNRGCGEARHQLRQSSAAKARDRLLSLGCTPSGRDAVDHRPVADRGDPDHHTSAATA